MRKYMEMTQCWKSGAGAVRFRPVPGRTSEGAPGGRPVPVAGQCRWPAGAGCRPVPVAGRCRLPAGAGWES